MTEDLKEAAWEDLAPFRMEQADIDEMIQNTPGCTVTWAAKNGQTMGVYVHHAVINGDIWLTTTGNRSKTRAWERDPRTSLIFAVEGIGAVTALGTIELRDNAEERTVFLNALFDKYPEPEEMRESYLKHMDTPGRLVGPVKVEKYITFDYRKLVW